MSPLQKSYSFRFRPGFPGQLQREFPLRFWRMAGSVGRALSYDHTDELDSEVRREMSLADRRLATDAVVILRLDQAELDRRRQAQLDTKLVVGNKISWPAIELAMLLSHLAERDSSYAAALHLGIQGWRDPAHDTVVLPDLPLVERIIRFASVVHRTMPEVERKSKASLLEKQQILSSATPRAVVVERLRWLSERLRCFPALLERKFSEGEKQTRPIRLDRLEYLGDVKPRNGWILEEELLSERDLKEALVDDREMVQAIKGAGEALLMELIRSADRGTKEALLMRLLTDARIEKAVLYAEWMDRIIRAVKGDHEGYTLTELIQIAPDELCEAILLEAVLADDKRAQEAIFDAAMDIAENETGQNRPAMLMDDDFTAHWKDVEFQEIWEAYRDGLDKLKVPGTDYDYSKNPAQRRVVDKNGIPYDPYGPINKPDVEVYGSALIDQHPIPQYSEVGREEIVVDTYVLTDIMLFIHHWKKREAARYGGMTAQQAVHDMLDKLWAYIDGMNANARYPEYLRAFRHARWYAEAILNRHTIYTIRRSYADWRSQEHNWDVGAPHLIENVVITGGLFASTAQHSRLELYLSNYVDGTLTFNARVKPGSTLTVVVDDKEVVKLGEGTWVNVSAPVPMGDHKIAFLGDGTVEYSYIRLSGHRFLGYTVLGGSQSTISGHGALTLWLQSLLKYYQDHHTKKTKGSRDPWINTEHQSR